MNKENFIEYLGTKGISSVTHQRSGCIWFMKGKRQFQLSPNGWFRSMALRPSHGSHGWYLVFKSLAADTKPGMPYSNDSRDACCFLKDGSFDYDGLTARIEKAGILN